jgi:hypothetical protein
MTRPADRRESGHMSATQTSDRLSDAQLQEVLAIAGGCDSVELKLTVPADHHRSTIMALGLDPIEAQIRLVTFFDTPDLKLNKSGVVVRARRVSGRADDTVIKLRPVVPAELPPKLRKQPSLGVEFDAMPGGYVCSASMKARLESSNDVKRVLAGEKSIRKLFTKAQREFYADHADIELDSLSILGPIFVLKLKDTPPELGRELVTEMWLYPDGARILELSTKCPPSEMFQVAAEARAFLTGKDIPLTGDQQTKTKTALNYFAESLPPD